MLNFYLTFVRQSVIGMVASVVTPCHSLEAGLQTKARTFRLLDQRSGLTLRLASEATVARSRWRWLVRFQIGQDVLHVLGRQILLQIKAITLVTSTVSYRMGDPLVL